MYFINFESIFETNIYYPIFVTIEEISERIRLADINAPEIYTTEGQIAKAALENLTLGKYVCLDTVVSLLWYT